MAPACRIVKPRHAEQAFSGDGARLFGGRWNLPGTPVVYTSATISLCALEMLVHLRDFGLLSSYVHFSVVFRKDQVERLDRSLLPANWRSYPAPAELAILGETWVESGSSVVLDVPSVIVANESNYLLNPLHPDFSSLKIRGPFPFEFDSRLMR